MASANPTDDHTSPPHPSSHSSALSANTTSPPSRRDLKSWWKGFKLPSKHHESQDKPQGIFGVPLRQSITYANVAISLIDEKGQSYIYGYVPIVVAKCGVYLKEKATGVEGIFRLNGSEKRIKELKSAFDSPDRYGKGLVWDGYTVHDAATIFRRYLNDLPEPVVPLDLYEKFREPLRGATKQAVGDAEGPQFVENFDEKAAIVKYQSLIKELPPLNKQLLLYILDLLAVFAAKSDENRMNSQNLAAIFQPGMLSHPNHAMAPEEYRLNQCVIIFLIENQDHFLIGMQGTAADEETKKEMELGTSSGLTTPNPNRKSGGIGRSASSASAGADSVRREGKVRRNRSVSSRHSKQEGSTTPNSVVNATTPTSSLGRSNTVPSKKSPAVGGGKFKKHDPSSHLEPLTQASPTEEPSHSEQSSLAPAAVGGAMAGRSQERLLEVPQEVSTPSKDRNLPSLFQRSPTDSSDKRQPNKLKKKRIPGSLNPSAQSSNASLSQSHHSNAPSPGVEKTNPMDQGQQATIPEQVTQQHLAELQQTPVAKQNSELSADVTPRASQIPSNNNLHPEYPLRGKRSPPGSLHSSYNEGSDLEPSTEDQPSTQTDQTEKDKKKRWRMSKPRKDEAANLGSPPRAGATRGNIGSTENVETTGASSASASSKPRKSFSGDNSEGALAALESQGGAESGKDKDESKGPIGWIRSKYREAKENAEQRRNKSPPADRPGHSASSLPRGKSMDVKRDQDRKEEEKDKQALKEQQEKESAGTQPPASQPAAPPPTGEANAEAPAAA